MKEQKRSIAVTLKQQRRQRNGDQRKKECEEAQATKGKEDGKVRERHRPAFKYEISTSHTYYISALKGGD
jgi:hypothetical protein